MSINFIYSTDTDTTYDLRTYLRTYDLRTYRTYRTHRTYRTYLGLPPPRLGHTDSGFLWEGGEGKNKPLPRGVHYCPDPGAGGPNQLRLLRLPPSRIRQERKKKRPMISSLAAVPHPAGEEEEEVTSDREK